jgi:hypothetical protein
MAFGLFVLLSLGGASAQNLVNNPGFENALIPNTDWTVTGGAKRDIGLQHTGQYAGRACLQGFPGNITQTVTIPQNGNCLFSFWSRVVGAPGPLDVTAEIIGVLLLHNAKAPEADYTQFSSLVTLSSGGIQIVFACGFNVPSPAWIIDDVSLTKVP